MTELTRKLPLVSWFRPTTSARPDAEVMVLHWTAAAGQSPDPGGWRSVGDAQRVEDGPVLIGLLRAGELPGRVVGERRAGLLGVRVVAAAEGQGSANVLRQHAVLAGGLCIRCSCAGAA